jgi:hypothetical protein
MLLEDLKLDAQEALDDLRTRNLLPFKLTAHKVESIGAGEFILRFNDGRLSSVDVSWSSGDSFTEAVRLAVKSRVQRLSGSSATLRPRRPGNARPH